ncbi:hypothetical protein MMC28_003187 [Mycoblastus sanguinarius]|nr:hypothetical protein [Mycoblastus sanguinarius]
MDEAKNSERAELAQDQESVPGLDAERNVSSSPEEPLALWELNYATSALSRERARKKAKIQKKAKPIRHENAIADPVNIFNHQILSDIKLGHLNEWQRDASLLAGTTLQTLSRA